MGKKTFKKKNLTKTLKVLSRLNNKKTFLL